MAPDHDQYLIPLSPYLLTQINHPCQVESKLQYLNADKMRFRATTFKSHL